MSLFYWASQGFTLAILYPVGLRKIQGFSFCTAIINRLALTEVNPIFRTPKSTLGYQKVAGFVNQN